LNPKFKRVLKIAALILALLGILVISYWLFIYFYFFGPYVKTPDIDQDKLNKRMEDFYEQMRQYSGHPTENFARFQKFMEKQKVLLADIPAHSWKTIQGDDAKLKLANEALDQLDSKWPELSALLDAGSFYEFDQSEWKPLDLDFDEIKPLFTALKIDAGRNWIAGNTSKSLSRVLLSLELMNQFYKMPVTLFSAAGALFEIMGYEISLYDSIKENIENIPTADLKVIKDQILLLPDLKSLFLYDAKINLAVRDVALGKIWAKNWNWQKMPNYLVCPARLNKETLDTHFIKYLSKKCKGDEFKKKSTNMPPQIWRRDRLISLFLRLESLDALEKWGNTGKIEGSENLPSLEQFRPTLFISDLSMINGHFVDVVDIYSKFQKNRDQALLKINIELEKRENNG
jgi:hypothetical protein